MTSPLPDRLLALDAANAFARRATEHGHPEAQIHLIIRIAGIIATEMNSPTMASGVLEGAALTLNTSSVSDDVCAQLKQDLANAQQRIANMN